MFRVDLLSRIPQTEEFRVDKFSRKLQKFAKSRNLIRAKIYPLKVQLQVEAIPLMNLGMISEQRRHLGNGSMFFQVHLQAVGK